MFRYISENKGILILAAMMLASFLWMTSQIRDPGGPSLLERGVNAAVYPFVKGVDVIAGTAKGVWEGYFYLVGLGSENDRLSKENGDLYAKNIELTEKLARQERLSGISAVREQASYDTLTAQVIGRDPTSWFRSVWVDAGSHDGVADNMPVEGAKGLVGRVRKSFGVSCRLMLITHPASSVSCIIERTRENGILSGDGGQSCRLDYVDKKADVIVGDVVITSGLDRVFPKGLPVGVVTKVSRDAPGLFQDVEVEPSADLEHLEEVLIIKYVPETRQ